MTDVNFHDWLTEAAKADRADVIKGLLEPILLLANDEELRSLKQNLGYLTDKRISDEVLLALFGTMPPSDMGSINYVTSRLRDSSLSRESLGLFLPHLGEAAGACLLNCLYVGEYTMAMRIYADYPSQFPMEVHLSGGMRVKDFPVDCRSDTMEGFGSTRDIRGCIEMLADPSIIAQGDSNDDVALYWAMDADKQKESLRHVAINYEGKIPVLAGNTLQMPELALALADARNAPSQFPDIYSHFPAWVENEYLKDCPGAIGFTSQIKSTWGEDKDRIYTDLSDYEGLRSEVFTDRYNNVSNGIRALKTLEIGLATQLPPDQHNLYHRYLEYFADDYTLMGLEQRPGQTLALIPLDTLSRVEISPVDEFRLVETIGFCENFFPLDVLINRHIGDKTYPLRAEQKKVFEAVGAVHLLTEIAQSRHKEAVFELLPPKMIEDAFAYAGFAASANALVELQERFGWRPQETERDLQITTEKLQALSDSGYDLWVNDAHTQRRQIMLKGNLDDPLPYLQLLRMGGYPKGQPEPTIEAALRNASRRNNATFATAFLQFCGPIEVAKVARTRGEWDTYMSIFTQEEKRTALDLFPKKRREAYFSADLGL
ncbi:hypothetical protein IFT48_00025 [Pseudomonas fluorescens]|uniref:hypothetical protein n=1 Tax=Pseudomonas fluorescens TaxID=294 RepID=UPI00193096D2|nr:hypothetical protein [Pseudomonas fluorescens]MBD8088378.1 hypothetical protein [Pseudomonas fluorescens]